MVTGFTSENHDHRLVLGEDQQILSTVLIGIHVKDRVRTAGRPAEVDRLGLAAVEVEQIEHEPLLIRGDHRESRPVVGVHEFHGDRHVAGRQSQGFGESNAVGSCGSPADHAFLRAEDEDLRDAIAIDVAGFDGIGRGETGGGTASHQTSSRDLHPRRDRVLLAIGRDDVEKLITVEIGDYDVSLPFPRIGKAMNFKRWFAAFGIVGPKLVDDQSFGRAFDHRELCGLATRHDQPRSFGDGWHFESKLRTEDLLAVLSGSKPDSNWRLVVGGDPREILEPVAIEVFRKDCDDPSVTGVEFLRWREPAIPFEWPDLDTSTGQRHQFERTVRTDQIGDHHSVTRDPEPADAISPQHLEFARLGLPVDLDRIGAAGSNDVEAPVTVHVHGLDGGDFEVHGDLDAIETPVFREFVGPPRCLGFTRHGIGILSKKLDPALVVVDDHQILEAIGVEVHRDQRSGAGTDRYHFQRIESEVCGGVGVLKDGRRHGGGTHDGRDENERLKSMKRMKGGHKLWYPREERFRPKGSDRRVRRNLRKGRCRV